MKDHSKSISQVERSRKYFKLQLYSPYPYQRRFHEMKDPQGKVAKARCLMAANQIGKTLCGGAEAAIHATGLYPDWWDGPRFAFPPHLVCSGVNSYRTRDLIQKELLGTANKDAEDDLGTGWIPKHCLIDTDRKPGIPGAVEKIHVRHARGRCEILLLGYEDGAAKVMGERIDYGWMDEEPPPEIWSQYVRGTIATGGYLALTFTPEEGMTQVVFRFKNDCPPNYALMQASWEDAPHITAERREELLREMLPHERDMRSRGDPVVGDSMIFPIVDDDIRCDSFKIPEQWPQILGIDFGGDHPFACVKIAFDPSGKKKKGYIVDCTKQRRLTIPQECSIIKGMGGDKTPVAWPHDGNKQDKQSGRPVADLYRDEGVKMLEQHFSNPPEPGKPEGTGGQGIEAGLKRMYWAMTEGRLKVFAHLSEWFKEKAMFHRKDGKVVALEDDLMAASRYAYVSALDSNDGFRFAETIRARSDFMRKLKFDSRPFR